MGAATSGRAGARALSLLLVSGCGSTVSLDAIGTVATGSSSTGPASTGPFTTVDGSSSTGDAPPDVPTPDVPGPPQPPPEACPAECEVELPLVWAWDETLPPTANERRMSAMVRALDGSLVVAEHRDGEVWLTQVGVDGSFVWTGALELSCDCEVVDMTIGRDGELVVLGEGSVGNGVQIFALGSYLLGFGAPLQNWITWDIAYGTLDRDARVGSAIPLEDGGIAVLVAEVGLTPDPLLKDWFLIYYYALGTQQSSSFLDTQLATDAPRRPRGAALPDGRIAMTLPGSSVVGTGDYVLWLQSAQGRVSAIELLPGPADAMAAGPNGAVVVAGSIPSSPAEVVLHAAGLPLMDPPAWLLSNDVPSTTAHAPLVVVDGEGSATVALWTTAGAPDDPGEGMVALWRIAADGTPVWSTTLPLPASDSPLPVALSLADDGDLLLAALVDGQLHLERREQACQCD